jgi:hypothetical protein
MQIEPFFENSQEIPQIERSSDACSSLFSCVVSFAHLLGMFVTNWSLMFGLQNFSWPGVVEHVPSRGCWLTLVSLCFLCFWILVMFVSGFYNGNRSGSPL